MKAGTWAKVGSRQSNPGYRTPSSFKVRRSFKAKNYGPTNLQITNKQIA